MRGNPGILAVLTLAACSGTTDDSTPDYTPTDPLTPFDTMSTVGETAETADTAGAEVTVSFSFVGLQPLGANSVYVAWIVDGSMFVPVGAFDWIDGVGAVEPGSTSTLFQEGLVPAAVRDSSTAQFAVSIEAAGSSYSSPGPTLLAGGFVPSPGAGVRADLSIAHPRAFGDDYTTAAGSYILDTPTTASIADDYDQGVWWLVPGEVPQPSLVVPTLANKPGWTYEGWVVDEDGPVSTGTFDVPFGADSDLGGSAAGTDPAPAFPGQDFITPPRSLVDHQIVISVEPVPDNDPAGPFFFKPLSHVAVDPGSAGVSQDMVNGAAALTPTGTASIQ